MEDLLSVCESVVETGLSSGADEVEAYAALGAGVTVEIQKNDLHMATTQNSEGIGIRLFAGGSLGFAYTNVLASDGLRESVGRALAIASAAPADEHNGLPAPTRIEPLDGLVDPDASAFDTARALELAISMLRTARGYDARVTVDGGGLVGHRGRRAIATSRGVRAEEDVSLYYCQIMGMARDGDDISSFDYQFEHSHRFSGIDPAGAAERFAESVVRSIGAVTGESFTGPVILAPKAAASIVAGPIEFAVDASRVQKETSRFAGKLGEAVASDLLSVVDDATLADGFASASFDREGQSPQVLPLLQSGVLRNFLYDTSTARREGKESTGHAAGGVSSVPFISATNLVFGAGETAYEDMIAGVDRGVLVTRFSGNVDPVSGDFSGTVKGGRMIRSGKLAEPLSGTMIAGNTFDLLPGISAVSRERERLFSMLLPYIRLDAVTVTSG